ncbi:hypothetical protein ACK34S_12300 [Aeromonas hydrophila]|uniref:hypothetical protein n=1 Tax=Aeromonas hydrophila TaxID=644 RepID=UPI00398877F8
MRLSEVIKFNENKEISSISSAYLYVFEQISSVYQYTISRLYGDSAESNIFSQQLRLTGAVKKIFKKNEEKFKFIMNLIDDGMKTLDLLEKLKGHSSLFDERDIKNIENTLERDSILFSKSFVKHPFSFYAMHSLLENPLPVLQTFLYLPAPIKIIESVTTILLKKWDDNHSINSSSDIINIFNSFIGPKKNIISFYDLNSTLIDNNLDASSLIKKYLYKNVKDEYKDFSNDLINSINHILCTWSLEVLSQLCMDKEDFTPIIESILKVNEKEGINSISISEKHFKKLCFLGQSDLLGELIACQFKARYLKDDSLKSNILGKSRNDLHELDQWFKACKMPYVTSMSQIPGQISSMLFFRLEHAKSIKFITMSDSNEFIEQTKSKVDDIQKLTTHVIHRCLYLNEAPYFPAHRTDTLMSQSLDDILPSEIEEDIQQLPNIMMKDWVVYDKKLTRDRFKRPLKYFLSHINDAESNINKQQQKSIIHGFPIRSGYPLPFWCLSKRALK